MRRSNTASGLAVTSADGAFSWGVYTREGEPLHSGVAENWDDARLAMIENVGFSQERTREGEALTHSEREGLDATAGGIGEVYLSVIFENDGADAPARS